MFTLGFVLKLHKILTRAEGEIEENNDTSQNRSALSLENYEAAEAVAFEPSLFTNLMIHY